MDRLKIFAAALMLFTASATAFAQEDDKKPKDMRTMAEEASDRLCTMLDLEDWQVFRLDSTFFHDYSEVTAEWEKLRRSGATNKELYMTVSDRIYAGMDSTIQTIFTPEQWNKYLKSEFGKEKRARDKRIAKRASASKK